MRYLKKKNYDGTIRKVISDDGSIIHGLVGTVDDLLKAEVFDYADCSGSMWAFIQIGTYNVWFGYSREHVIDMALVYGLPCARSF